MTAYKLKVGFTGTREGMTVRQWLNLADWFTDRATDQPRTPSEVHHGCCVGADAEFVLAVIRGRVGETENRSWAEIHGHPSNLTAMTDRQIIEQCDVVRPELPPLDRNQRIVDATNILLACPRLESEEHRSGTWATIRYARSIGRPVVIFYPSGMISIDQPKESPDGK